MVQDLGEAEALERYRVHGRHQFLPVHDLERLGLAMRLRPDMDGEELLAARLAYRWALANAASIKGDPKRVALACLLFAAAETFQIQLQGSEIIPSQFVEMIPYVLTIVALATIVGRAAAPAALGRSSS